MTKSTIQDEIRRAITVIESLEWKHVGSVKQECSWCGRLAVNGGHDDDCELIESLIELRERVAVKGVIASKRPKHKPTVIGGCGMPTPPGYGPKPLATVHVVGKRKRSARECQARLRCLNGALGKTRCRASGSDAKVRWCNRRLQWLCDVCYADRG